MEQLNFFQGPRNTKTDSPTDEPPARGPASDPSLPAHLLQTLASELLPSGLGHAIQYAFAAMEVAEEEITSAKNRYPDKGKELYAAFRFLSPSEVLSKSGHDLYRAHARELLDRVAQGADLRPGTDAELLAALVEITLAAPPSRELTLLYMKLFTVVFPEKAHEFFEGISPNAYELERIGEFESELRRKLATERDCHSL